MTMDRIERRMGYVLKGGSLLSTAFLALGILVFLVTPAAETGPVLIQTGLLMVIATPIVRVVVAMVGFVQAHEWKFVVMTLAVLGVLAASVVAAIS